MKPAATSQGAAPSSLRRQGAHAIVIGHRGASAHVPENTLPAFEAAWNAGASWVEADTQPTADGVQVIVHDDDLDRTTSGTWAVRSTSSEAIARLDIVGLPETRVPTLAALLEQLGPERALLLEIKGEHTLDDVAEILRLCRDSGFDEHVFLQSFEVSALAHLHELAPARPFGLLVERLDADPVARCRKLGAVAYNPEFREVIANPDLVAVLHEAGITVAVWTCDDPADWALLTQAGVDAIITNTPAELIAWQNSTG